MRFTKIEKIAARVAVGALALVSLLSMTVSTRAQEAERPYPKMLPLSQYLMDRNAAIALARSAAPEGISKDASVLVLTPKGWETAVKGTNGFVCMAGPSWTASIDFYDVWSPKQRGAICLNPAAVRSILPIFRKLTEMTLAGVTSAKERIAGIQEAYAKKEIPPVESGAMSYMMSKDAYLTHLGNSHNLCHVMFFLPMKDPAELNADDPNSPISSTSIWFPDPDKPDSPLNKRAAAAADRANRSALLVRWHSSVPLNIAVWQQYRSQERPQVLPNALVVSCAIVGEKTTIGS